MEKWKREGDCRRVVRASAGDARVQTFGPQLTRKGKAEVSPYGLRFIVFFFFAPERLEQMIPITRE